MGISHAYGTPSTEKEATELIEKAIDLGCTFLTQLKYMEQLIIPTTMKNLLEKY